MRLTIFLTNFYQILNIFFSKPLRLLGDLLLMQYIKAIYKFLSCDFIYLFIYFIIICVYLYMHMYNFLCSDSLLYFFLFLSTLHSVYTRDCSRI